MFRVRFFDGRERPDHPESERVEGAGPGADRESGAGQRTAESFALGDRPRAADGAARAWYFSRPPTEGSKPPAGIRGRVEAATGAELDGARVHDGDDAKRQAASLGARAFTVGRDVFLGDRDASDSLLTHELVHVAQQGARPASPGLLPVDPVDSPSEREARAGSRDVLAGRPTRVSSSTPRVARAPVSDYGAKETLVLDRAFMESEQKQVPGLLRLDALYQVLLPSDVQQRFKSDPEERDAVFDVAWQLHPARLTAQVEKRASIPARGSSSKALLYLFTFAPKAPGDPAARDTLTIAFELEGAGAAVVTPPTVTGATRPAGMTGTDFPPGGTAAYFAAHADEGLQFYGWIAAQTADAYDQILVTSETTGTGAAAKKHESTLRVVKTKGVAPDVTLIGEFRLDEKRPAADYRRDVAEDLIAKAQAKGDPGQPTAPDKLGAVTGISAFPADEQFSARMFAYKTFETETSGGTTRPGLRNAETRGVVNVAGSTKQVLVRVIVAPTATAKTFDLEIVRVGEVGKGVEIDPAKAKPDVARAAGFPTTGDAAAVSAFLATRYKGLSGVTGTTPAALSASANKLLETEAQTAGFFLRNYGVTVLDATTAARRLHDVNGLDPLQTADTKDFTGPELWTLELAFETLGKPLLGVLSGTAFARQKVEIVDKGATASPRFMPSTKDAGLTLWSTTGTNRTVILFDNVHDVDATSFAGTGAGVMPAMGFTVLHEMGHAVDASTSARDAFNKKFPSLRGFTDYARSAPGKEAFEEAFAIFQSDPGWLQTNHKDVYDWFVLLAASGRPPP